MRQNKEKKSKKIKKNNKDEVSTKNQKENKPFKKRLIKFIVCVFILLLILSVSFLTFKGYIFKKLVKEMFNNSPSTVFDSNKNVIAQIGAERNRENVDFSEIPSNLKNAYISIEDQRFYKHHGVDVKRTGAAIFSYIIKYYCLKISSNILSPYF